MVETLNLKVSSDTASALRVLAGEDRQAMEELATAILRDAGQGGSRLLQRLRAMVASPEAGPSIGISGDVADAALFRELDGGAATIDYFEGWVPSFHDGEVLSLHLDAPAGRLSLWIEPTGTLGLTDPPKARTSNGHPIFRFDLEEVTNLELQDFNPQIVLWSLTIERKLAHVIGEPTQVYRVTLEPCIGLSGWIECCRIRIVQEDMDGTVLAV